MSSTFTQNILRAWQEKHDGTLERLAPWQKHQGVKVENIGFWLERLYLSRQRMMLKMGDTWTRSPWGKHVMEELRFFATWYEQQPAYDPEAQVVVPELVAVLAVPSESP
jgi:hypothetical protein